MTLQTDPPPRRPTRAEPPPALDRRAVRAYDIRGVVGRHLHATDARALGLSYAELAAERGHRRIAVGRDGRLTSPALEAALVGGLVAGGLQVERLGLCPTPQVSFAVRARGLDGGIMVTASHNPPEENGFKILLGPDRIHGEALHALVATPGRRRLGGSARNVRVGRAYLAQLLAAAPNLKPSRVVWDSGNGATGRIVERLTAALPGRHLTLNTRVDGRFPGHHPDPAVAENLAELASVVVDSGSSLGIAFDGDGDRIGIVDDTGAILWADQLLLFLAEDLLRRRPGAAVVGDVKSSAVLFDGVRALGGRPVMTPSGYVLVREAMKREGALLGGELSGHIFYADEWDGGDDALYVAVRTLRALSDGGRTLAEFRRSLPPVHATPELRIPCPDARKHAVVRETQARLTASGASFDPAHGLRVTTPDGWWLLRASGTEPKLTCRAEAATPAGLARLESEMRTHLEASGVAGALPPLAGGDSRDPGLHPVAALGGKSVQDARPSRPPLSG